jgi:hypothetical protein
MAHGDDRFNFEGHNYNLHLMGATAGRLVEDMKEHIEELEEELALTTNRADDVYHQLHKCQEQLKHCQHVRGVIEKEREEDLLCLAETRKERDKWHEEHDLQAEWHTKLEAELAAAEMKIEKARQIIGEIPPQFPGESIIDRRYWRPGDELTVREVDEAIKAAYWVLRAPLPSALRNELKDAENKRISELEGRVTELAETNAFFKEIIGMTAPELISDYDEKLSECQEKLAATESRVKLLDEAIGWHGDNVLLIKLPDRDTCFHSAQGAYQDAKDARSYLDNLSSMPNTDALDAYVKKHTEELRKERDMLAQAMVDYRAEAQYQERERAAAEALAKEVVDFLGHIP